MTAEQRSSIENGIWLCQVCAKLIDCDEERFTIKLLHDWKRQAETEVRHQLEGEHSRHGASPDLVEKIDTLVIASQESAGKIDELKTLLREYANQLIDHLTPQSSPAVASGIVEMIPLDNGYWLHPDDVATEGLCNCEHNSCVGSNQKVYCYFNKALSEWVIRKGLYWKCYDELIACPRCGKDHKRGHVGKLGGCDAPYKDQSTQN